MATDPTIFDPVANQQAIAESLTAARKASAAVVEMLPQAAADITAAKTNEANVIANQMPAVQTIYSDVVKARDNIAAHAGNPFAEVLGVLSNIPGLERLSEYNVPKQQATIDRDVARLQMMNAQQKAVHDATEAKVDAVTTRVQLGLQGVQLASGQAGAITAGIGAMAANDQYALDQIPMEKLKQIAASGDYAQLGFNASPTEIRKRIQNDTITNLAIQNAKLNYDTAVVTKNTAQMQASETAKQLAFSHMTPTQLGMLAGEAAKSEADGKPFLFGGVPMSSQELTLAQGKSSEDRQKAFEQTSKYQNALGSAVDTVNEGSGIMMRFAQNVTGGAIPPGTPLSGVDITTIPPAFRTPFKTVADAQKTLLDENSTAEERLIAATNAAGDVGKFKTQINDLLKNAPKYVQDATSNWLTGNPLTGSQQGVVLLDNVSQLSPAGEGLALNTVHDEFTKLLRPELYADKSMQQISEGGGTTSDLLAALTASNQTVKASNLIDKVLDAPSKRFPDKTRRYEMVQDAADAATSQYLALTLQKLSRNGITGFDQMFDPKTGSSLIGPVGNISTGTVFRKITEIERSLHAQGKIPADFSMAQLLMQEAGQINNINGYLMQNVAPRTMYGDTLYTKVLGGQNFVKSVSDSIKTWQQRWVDYRTQPGTDAAITNDYVSSDARANVP